MVPGTFVAPAIQAVVEEWKRFKVNLLPPNPVEDARGKLQRLGVPVAEDLIILYALTGGMDYETAEGLFCLWPLARILKHGPDLTAPDRIVFADFLLESHFYSARMESSKISSVWIADDRIANSLEEFFALYLARSDKLGLHW